MTELYTAKAVCSSCGDILPADYRKETEEVFVDIGGNHEDCTGNIILVRPDKQPKSRVKNEENDG